MTIDAWLRDASNEFADAMIPSARLDAEMILAHTVGKPRTWLHAHGDDELDPRRRDIADARAELRLERVPVAYIIGHKEFYSRRFMVTPHTLIPRPESEVLIDLMSAHQPPHAKRLVDVGTGSGALGITAKLAYPELDVTLLDIDESALKIARKNAAIHNATVRLERSYLLDHYPLKADVVIANLPYVDRAWPERSPELASEPAIALYADDNGLALIKELLDTVTTHLSSDGIVILEADPRQFNAIAQYASAHGLREIEHRGFGIVFVRQ